VEGLFGRDRRAAIIRKTTEGAGRDDDQGMKTMNWLIRSAVMALAGLGVQQLWRKMSKKRAALPPKSSSRPKSVRSRVKTAKPSHAAPSSNHHPRRGMKRHE
jgi:hypothetical protein